MPHCHSVHPWSPTPHPNAGPIQTGAGTVYIENCQAARLNDMGVHAACCGPNIYTIITASSTVVIEGSAAARLGDSTLHCGTAAGSIVTGAGTVTIGG